MKKHLAISIATILALSAPGIAKASPFFVTDTIGGVPTVSGATLETFDEPSPSILTLSGNAYLVTGGRGLPDYYTAPYFSGSTAAYFGESPTLGYDASQYVAVETGGSATLSFSTPQNYLGLLWGSVDVNNNYLTFYDNANNVIGMVLGTDLRYWSGWWLGPEWNRLCQHNFHDPIFECGRQHDRDSRLMVIRVRRCCLRDGGSRTCQQRFVWRRTLYSWFRVATKVGVTCEFPSRIKSQNPVGPRPFSAYHRLPDFPGRLPARIESVERKKPAIRTFGPPANRSLLIPPEFLHRLAI